MASNLLGNPHSASASSQLSSRLIDDTRLHVLRFFNASPDDFDVVFVANATAAIKLVADAFRDTDAGFWYGYHADAHTSLVGIRELADRGSRCFRDDAEVDEWISNTAVNNHRGGQNLGLFAYPAQSNMTGHRPPLAWCGQIRDATASSPSRMYTLYDAAGLVSTCPLDLGNMSNAPDFTTLSFYKIFGFPDLGALIVRKESADVLRRRRYFGGGTVDMVITAGEPWHSKKAVSLHSSLEDGTTPFHSILALNSALSAHTQLYGSMSNISRHATFLARKAYDALSDLRHANGTAVCNFYGVENSDGNVWGSRGPVIAFNLLDSRGRWVGASEVEKLAIVKNIQLRTGGLCNPGGVARHLGLSPEEMRKNFASGQRCGDNHDIINGKPVGAVRISFGAMSSLSDVEALTAFVQEFYVDTTILQRAAPFPQPPIPQSGFFIESLSIYPIKSCAAYSIPPDTKWRVKESGLDFDREWCLVHQGTGSALSQKRYPRMALLRPSVDLNAGTLRILFLSDDGSTPTLHISLDEDASRQSPINVCDVVTSRTSSVCGDNVVVQVYDSPQVAEFFTNALGVPCTLARCPPSPGNRIGRLRRPRGHDAAGHNLGSPASNFNNPVGKSILLANESPILLISRSSVNRLNEDIKAASPVGRAVSADSFRGNIVVAEDRVANQSESPYIEESWQSLHIGEDNNTFEVMGPCQRCQMVCIDQKSAQRRQEPFSTLAKTRRRDGKVWFGVHLCLAQEAQAPGRANVATGKKGVCRTSEKSTWLRVGDRVVIDC
jgi:molybdenum cofactor sulfurtransferase